MTPMNMSRDFGLRNRPAAKPLPPQPKTPGLIPVYEGRKLVGHYGLTWNNEGTRQIRVYIPAGDVE